MAARTKARKRALDLLFEAAVAGGIPIMRPLRESLVGEPVSRVMGIVNGTTNFNRAFARSMNSYWPDQAIV